VHSVFCANAPVDSTPPRRQFSGLGQLANDFRDESEATFPEVIFVEPTYTNGPEFGTPSDDHPTTSVAGGQDFLRKVYMSLIGNPSRWARTVLIVTYDEHGGFFDHYSPPQIATNPPRGANYQPFDCGGVRVPGIVISPLVPAAAVYAQLLDHTSILRFLAKKFAPTEIYSDKVEERSTVFTGQISDILSLAAPRDQVLLRQASWRARF
jgi:phospholipase C